MWSQNYKSIFWSGESWKVNNYDKLTITWDLQQENLVQETENLPAWWRNWNCRRPQNSTKRTQWLKSYDD